MNTTTRRMGAILVAGALALTACGGSDDDSSASTSAASTETTAAPTTTEAAAETTVEATVATTTADPAATSTPPTTDATDTTAGGTADAPLEQLRVYHPETLAFAAPFVVMQSEGLLDSVASDVTIDTWTSPDVLRSLLVNGESDVTAVPTYVGANLYDRDIDVKMAAVTVWGLLWLIGPDGTPAEWSSLEGQTVMVPFPNDMPDLVFQYLAEANGLTPGEDFTIEYYNQPTEVVGRLVNGEGTFAVLPEHVATVALAQAGQNGQSLTRMFDMQEQWATATGGSPRIPQAGIVVTSEIVDDPTALGGILDALDASVATVNAADPATITMLAEATGVPEPVVTDVIPRLNLEVVPAADAREELERFYQELSTLSPDIIGGELPDDGFYLADPR